MTALERRSSVSLALIFALRMLGLFLVLPVFALEARKYPGGDDPALVGLAMGIYGLTQAVLQLPLGMASDRWGRKPVILAGLAVFALGSALAAWAPSVHWLAAARALQGAGCRLGILTRNVRSLAQVTLQAIGLGDVFAEDDIIGRDEAEPKPSPAGLQYFVHRWQVDPAQVVMVGDYRFDLECGRAAGTRTLLVNAPDNPWPGMACWHLADCRAVLAHCQR